MAGRDPVEVPGPPELLGGRVTCIACLGLHVAGPQLGAPNLELDPKLLAELAAGLLILVGVGPKPIVQMQPDHRPRLESLDKGCGEGRRVGAAGDQDDPPRALGDQAALPHGAGEGGERRRGRHVGDCRNEPAASRPRVSKELLPTYSIAGRAI
jgi:hypothetical protein